jgi:hypothetical protein
MGPIVIDAPHLAASTSRVLPTPFYDDDDDDDDTTQTRSAVLLQWFVFTVILGGTMLTAP